MKFLNEILKKFFFVMEKTSKDVCDEVKNFPADMTEDMSQAGLDKFESLVCGSGFGDSDGGFQTNFLSFGLILLCTLFKF